MTRVILSSRASPKSTVWLSVWQMRRVVITKEMMAFAHENEEIMVDQVGHAAFDVKQP